MLLGACSSGGDDKAVALATAALAASDEGRWEDAVAGLSEVIDLQPGDTELLAQAHYNRGVWVPETRSRLVRRHSQYAWLGP